jgi:hypothetical protein
MVIIFSCAEVVSAQSQSMFGNRGPASQIGSNLNGSIVGGTTTFGTQSGTGTIGLSGQPVGASGSTALGGATAGTQGAFVGRDDTAGRFVGDQRLGQQTTGRRGNTAGRQLGNRGGGSTTGRAFGDTGQFGGQGGRNSSRRVIRPRQEIAFTYKRPAAEQINSSLNQRFTRFAARRPAMQGVTITIDQQGVATLSGQVTTAESRRLAALMVRLEPGVRSIDNQLTVNPSDN